jgi:uncharacterized membrane protein HdeD (DUF308 family)
MNSSGVSPTEAADLQAASENWGWILAAGIGLLILGIIALFGTVTTTVISTVLLGILLLIGGVAQIVLAFKGEGAGMVVLRLLMALLFLLGGWLLISRPLFGAATLTLLMALFFLFSGLTYLILGLAVRSEHWGWAVVTGIVGILLGILLLVHWPVSGLYAIGLFVAIELMLTGISAIGTAFMLHSSRPMLTQPAG